MNDITLDSIKKSIIKQIRTNNPRLLSEIKLDDEELNLLRSSVNSVIGQALNGWRTYDILVAYFMMDVGMRNYHDGTYWDDFWKEVAIYHTLNDQTILGKYFMEVLERYELAIYTGGNRKYVNNIMMHAFIPENEQYRDGFFNFILKFYRVVLNESIPDELDAHLQKIADVFRTDSFENYSDFRNLPLIQSIKIAMSDVSYFGHTVEKIIHRLAGDYESSEDVDLGRYERSFREWSNRKSNPKNKHRGIDENPFLQFDLRSQELFLTIPQLEIPSQSSNHVRILSKNNEKLYEDRLYASVQFGKVITDEKLIRLRWNPLEEFIVTIGGVERYRNDNPGFILLNKKGVMRRRVSQGFNMIIIPDAEPINLDTGTILETDQYSVKGFMIQRGQTLQVAGHEFTIEEEIASNLHIVSPSLEIDCRDQDGNKFDLFSKHPVIQISLSEQTPRFRLVVSHGMDSIRFDAIEQVINNPASTTNNDQVSMDLSEAGLRNKAGIYRIRYNGREVYRYVLIPNFVYEFEKEFYDTDEKSTFTYTGSSEPQSFDTSQGQVETKVIHLDGHEFVLTIQIPSRRFSFDKKKWFMFGTELYFRDTQYSNLFIYCPTLVYPEIRVKFHGSVPIGLEIEGRILTCEFKKISQISLMIENSEQNISLLKFYCGRFPLFKIRYNADYFFEHGAVTRKNLPENTWSICRETHSGTEYRFTNDIAYIPKDVDEFEIIEYYDDGFGSEKRIAARFSRGVNIPPHIAGCILAGDEFEKIIDRAYALSIPGHVFKNLIDIEKPYDVTAQKAIEEDYAGRKRESEAFKRILRAVKQTILQDKNTTRLKQRIRRFKDLDDDMTYRLCESYLKISNDEEVSAIKIEIQNRLANESHVNEEYNNPHSNYQNTRSYPDDGYIDELESSEIDLDRIIEDANRGDPVAQNDLGICFFRGDVVPQSYDKAAEWYKKAAAQGNNDALINLSLCYYNGRGVQQSYEEAARLTQKAAEDGDARAQYNMGTLCFYGIGVPQSYDKAAEWYKMAAVQNDADALFRLGQCYEYGFGVPVSLADAKTLYASAVNEGHEQAPLALDLYNQRCIEGTYDEEPYHYIKPGMRLDEVICSVMKEINNEEKLFSDEELDTYLDNIRRNILGIGNHNENEFVDDDGDADDEFIDDDELSDEDLDKILNAVGKTNLCNEDYSNDKDDEFVDDEGELSDEGIIEILDAIGKTDSYSEDYGDDEDIICEEDLEYILPMEQYMVEYIKNDAEDGNTGAQTLLASMYKFGNGVPKSYEEALSWYRRAAEDGSVEAMYEIGRLYESGCIAFKTEKQAEFWYKKAAEQEGD